MKKKICLVYHGQPRHINNMKEMISLLTDDVNEYHMAFTTWIDSDVSEMKAEFNDIFINPIEHPDENSINEFCNGNIFRSNGTKPLSNYYRQLYLRLKSISTIEKMKEKIDGKFDIIILLRTDAKVWKNISIYYDMVTDYDNSVYIGGGPNSSIFGSNIHDPESACPDTIYFSNESVMIRLLDQINRASEMRIGNVYHPETCQYNFFKLLNLNIKRLEFDAFVCPRIGENGLIEAVHYPMFK